MSGNTKSGRRGKKEKEEIKSKVGLDWTMPDVLDKTGREYWKKTLPELIKFGFLTDADLPAFSRLCDLHSLYRKLTQEISKKGVIVTVVGSNGQEKIIRNPAFDMKAKLMTPLKDLEARFGLTPKDRESVKVKKQSAKKVNIRDKYK